MPRLIHLNGPTGVGKSTVSALYAARHPLTLNLDADHVVQLVGGWQDDFFGAVDLVRPLSLNMVTTHLSSGNDVVMPQLITNRGQRAAFVAAAAAANASYREFVLLAPRETAIARYGARGLAFDAAIEALGGTRLIHQIYDDLAAYLTPETVVIETDGHSPEQTCALLMAALTEAGNPHG